ncbi:MULTISPECIES: hypothetical protein [unclassified Vibrio]|uniref:hypothetical protein n=1 Tax=unclassified Vibrio TaxID=2614977 RepID=UPI0020A5FA1F|nr:MULTISPECIES: hypothetical protein [unclassified Vibrio]
MKIKIKNYYDVLDYNYVLICTSNNNEKKAINRILKHRRELVINMNSLGCSVGLVNDVFVIHLTGTSGMEARESISRLVIEFLKRESNPNPSLILLAGFCWGNPKLTNQNDVIISSDIISLNSDTYLPDGQSYKATSYASSIDVDFIKNKIKTVITGTMVSLESLIAKTSKRDEIIKSFSHVVGGEMEAWGFVPSVGNTPWAVVKSVSDFGDDLFNRNTQAAAASEAATVTKDLIGYYQSEGHLDFNTTSSDNLPLTNALYGNEIKITNGEVNAINLNDYLHNMSFLIQYKLGYYVTSDEYGDDFIKYFSYLILEAVQNSFKHGRATEVNIKFDDKSIFIQCNGNDFDLNKLSNADGRGGQFAWLKFKENFIDNEYVTYKFHKKKHKFNLVKVNQDIVRIINNCTAKIVENKIGTGWSESEVLSYDNDCEAVYIDDRQISLPSRRFSLIEEAKRIIESGRIVFVSVSDQENEELYKSTGYGPDKLKIWVHNKYS